MSGSKTKKDRLIFGLAFALPVVVFVISLNIGSYPISPRMLFKVILSVFSPSSQPGLPAALKDIVFQIRLPRLLLAVAVGATLSVSGASLQALFKNPLVNEYILGISSGSAFGAAVSLVFLGKGFPPQIVAFVFGIAAVLAVLIIARTAGSNIVALLLTGIIVSAFFSALLALVEFFASPYALQALFYWLMGNMSLATWRDLALSTPLMAVGVILLIMLRWRMNVLSMSDQEAKAMGISVRREKILIIVACTLATAAATAVTGIIGWIGLVVPHLVRMVAGVDNRRVIPLSASLGASFLLAADALARSLASFEIPLGIFTSLIGIPFFLFLLKKSRRVWL
ncbi:MAG: iron ABC transporter permease [Candidatus Aminicenantes bacterium]|nr:iron ABC transporter permease [Candidatus Aminicenantes bacterium]